MKSLTSRDRMARALRGGAAGRPALAYLFMGAARNVMDAMGQLRGSWVIPFQVR